MANIKEVNRVSGKQSLTVFMQRIIKQKQKLGRTCTARNYQSTLRSFMRFRGGKDLALRELNEEMVQAYEAWLIDNGVRRNTSSFYMRILRAVYNRAVKKKLIRQRFPFRDVYTGIDKTSKRAVPLSVIKSIKDTDVSHSHSLELARDMFLMSFYLRGMSFVDMAHLRKSDLHGGYIHYNRSKTHQHLQIKVEEEMIKIIDRYKQQTEASVYLLPILNSTQEDEPRQQHNAANRIAYNLKNLAKNIGLQGSLTLYVARHSWATIARDNNIAISVISEGLGHDSVATTQIYLGTIQTAEVDKANASIIGLL